MSEDPELGTFGRFVETPVGQMGAATRAGPVELSVDEQSTSRECMSSPHRQERAS